MSIQNGVIKYAWGGNAEDLGSFKSAVRRGEVNCSPASVRHLTANARNNKKASSRQPIFQNKSGLRS